MTTLPQKPETAQHPHEALIQGLYDLMCWIKEHPEMPEPTTAQLTKVCFTEELFKRCVTILDAPITINRDDVECAREFGPVRILAWTKLKYIGTLNQTWTIDDPDLRARVAE